MNRRLMDCSDQISSRMASKVPPLSKSQSMAELLPPLVEPVERSYSRSTKVRGQPPDSIPFRKVWGGRFDAIPSTRAPSEASSCMSEARSSSRSSKGRGRPPDSIPLRKVWGGKFDSIPSTRAPSETSSCMSEVSTRPGSRASSIASTVASSRLSSSSSSSAQRDAAQQCRLGKATSAPSLQLRNLAQNDSLPSLTIANVYDLDVDVASTKSSQDVNSEDIDETRRQLEWSCCFNDIEQAKICYSRGASLSQALSSGESPLFYAVRNKHFDFVEFLRQYDVDMNMRDKAGRTAMHIAAANNDVEGIRLLAQLGAKRQLKDYKGQTALHQAAAAGHRRVAELLLKMGADINVTDKAGLTAVAHAEFNNHFELADRLVKVARPISGVHERGLTYFFLRQSDD